MHPAIRISAESKRGCGYRQVGGIYLVADKSTVIPCGRLPIPFGVCPVCQANVPNRAFSWLNINAVLKHAEACRTPQLDIEHGGRCPLNQLNGWHGLIWVGAMFYRTPEEYLIEATQMGFSRRIGKVPHNFKLGETWVFLAHRRGIPKPFEFANRTDKWTPAIFSFFLPQRIEIVVNGSESDEVIDRYLKRGLSPVKVEPVTLA